MSSDYNHSADLKVLEQLKAPFVEGQVKKRKGPWDKKTRKNVYFTYIPVHYVRERLDDALGFNWDWEVLSVLPTSFQTKTKGEWDEASRTKVGGGEVIDTPGVVVTGRIIITLPTGKKVSRDGTGGASADKGMGPGDAQKIAASNALKRAAYMFGVGAYLALDSEEAIDDTTTFNNDFSGNQGGATLTPLSPTPTHLNVGQGTAAAPQFVPNTTAAPTLQPTFGPCPVTNTAAPTLEPTLVANPSPHVINTTDNKY